MFICLTGSLVNRTSGGLRFYNTQNGSLSLSIRNMRYKDNFQQGKVKEDNIEFLRALNIMRKQYRFGAFKD